MEILKIGPAHKTSKLDIEYCKSNFKLHTFFGELSSDMVMFQVIKMFDSVYIWIGLNNQPTLQDLSMAMYNQHGQVPVSTVLLGDSVEETSKNISTKLCKKLNKVVCVSLNVEDNRFNIESIEKRIQKEIVEFPEYF
ncbi:hypothetical protein CBL_05690 [Carabus blaptoides fortunei]